MTIWYDDNFGCYDHMEEEGMEEFYFEIQQTNVKKTCRGCGRKVMIQPSYDLCNGCAMILEQSGDLPCNS